MALRTAQLQGPSQWFMFDVGAFLLMCVSHVFLLCVSHGFFCVSHVCFLGQVSSLLDVLRSATCMSLLSTIG